MGYLSAYEDGKNREFRNFGIKNSDARKLPGRKHTKLVLQIFRAHSHLKA